MRYLFLSLWVLLLFSEGCVQVDSDVVYKTETLEIKSLTSNTFVHVSHLQTESFGKVACNGLIYKNNSEAIVWDTPTTDQVSEELLAWISSELHATVTAVIATHSHDDCLGGLNAFHAADIPSYANQLSLEFAQRDSLPTPTNGFNGQLDLSVGAEKVSCIFMGEGHTKDNIIGYIPAEKVLFGGCLLKAMKASKGYVGEANLEEWPITIAKIKERFQEIEFVVPGHGTAGGTALLNYTQDLFSKK